MPAFDDVEPFETGGGRRRREAVVEEGFYGVAFGVRVGVFGDEADETAWVMGQWDVLLLVLWFDSLRTSPMPGPPNTRISSLEEPPLSLIGMM